MQAPTLQASAALASAPADPADPTDAADPPKRKLLQQQQQQKPLLRRSSAPDLLCTTPALQAPSATCSPTAAAATATSTATAAAAAVPMPGTPAAGLPPLLPRPSLIPFPSAGLSTAPAGSASTSASTSALQQTRMTVPALPAAAIIPAVASRTAAGRGSATTRRLLTATSPVPPSQSPLLLTAGHGHAATSQTSAASASAAASALVPSDRILTGRPPPPTVTGASSTALPVTAANLPVEATAALTAEATAALTAKAATMPPPSADSSSHGPSPSFFSPTDSDISGGSIATWHSHPQHLLQQSTGTSLLQGPPRHHPLHAGQQFSRKKQRAVGDMSDRPTPCPADSHNLPVHHTYTQPQTDYIYKHHYVQPLPTQPLNPALAAYGGYGAVSTVHSTHLSSNPANVGYLHRSNSGSSSSSGGHGGHGGSNTMAIASVQGYAYGHAYLNPAASVTANVNANASAASNVCGNTSSSTATSDNRSSEKTIKGGRRKSKGRISIFPSFNTSYGSDDNNGDDEEDEQYVYHHFLQPHHDVARVSHKQSRSKIRKHAELRLISQQGSQNCSTIHSYNFSALPSPALSTADCFSSNGGQGGGLRRGSQTSSSNTDYTLFVDLDENSPLLYTHQHMHISKILAAQQVQAMERARLRRRVLTAGVFLFLAIIGLTLLTFCIQPLVGVVDTRIANIVATPDVFQFDMVLQGSNVNIVAVDVHRADLDVYASADAPIEFPDSAVTVRDVDADPLPPELLGHVRALNGTLQFPPLAITILNPSNTVGKLIYLQYPYTLIVRGRLHYATFMSLTHDGFDICSVHEVQSPSVIISRQCSESPRFPLPVHVSPP
ncbi:hypothetical protein BC831DRAFT_459527 [Entophlyctis helioformis]|nr:hypothetical protein BC831DRAFT_459527 [Entophlyctis helioformis]